MAPVKNAVSLACLIGIPVSRMEPPRVAGNIFTEPAAPLIDKNATPTFYSRKSCRVKALVWHSHVRITDTREAGRYSYTVIGTTLFTSEISSNQIHDVTTNNQYKNVTTARNKLLTLTEITTQNKLIASNSGDNSSSNNNNNNNRTQRQFGWTNGNCVSSDWQLVIRTSASLQYICSRRAAERRDIINIHFRRFTGSVRCFCSSDAGRVLSTAMHDDGADMILRYTKASARLHDEAYGQRQAIDATKMRLFGCVLLRMDMSTSEANSNSFSCCWQNIDVTKTGSSVACRYVWIWIPL